MGYTDLEHELLEEIQNTSSDVKDLKNLLEQQGRDFIDYKRNIELLLANKDSKFE